MGNAKSRTRMVIEKSSKDTNDYHVPCGGLDPIPKLSTYGETSLDGTRKIQGDYNQGHGGQPFD